MALTMPRVVQHPTPNYTPTLIRHDLFVLHDQEGHTQPSIAWLCDPRAKASANLCQGEGDGTVYQLVPLSMKAWAQCAFNGRALSLEMPGFAAKGFADDLLRSAALIAAWCCRAYAIPLVWAEGGQGRGLCCHHDLGAAGGGHVDVGPIGGDTWRRFMDFVRAADVELGTGPLPPFALHGLPGAHEIVALPVDVAPAPSHGGESRAEPGDTHDHPTSSGFAAHSVAALQADLNKILGADLDVDGWLGIETTATLKRAQARLGCTPDGVAGPRTWAALDRAMAA